MNLYKLTDEFNAAIELFIDSAQQDDLQTREVLPTLEDWLNETRENLDKKRLAVGAYIKNLEAEVEALKIAEKDMEARRKAKENKVGRLKEYLLSSLKATETKKVNGVEFDIAVQKNAPSVLIEDSNKIPTQYYVMPEVKSLISKTLLLEDLKKGIEIRGCKLVQLERISIK